MFRNYNRLCLVKKFRTFSFYPNAIALWGSWCIRRFIPRFLRHQLPPYRQFQNQLPQLLNPIRADLAFATPSGGCLFDIDAAPEVEVVGDGIVHVFLASAPKGQFSIARGNAPGLCALSDVSPEGEN